jgi:hypothetical protein
MSDSAWIPDRDLELVAFARRWAAGLENTGNAGAFLWKPLEAEACLRRIEAFFTAWEAYSADNSTGKRSARDEARKVMKEAMRDFANTSIRFNKLMSDEQKLYYGIRPADPERPRPEDARRVAASSMKNEQ